MIISIQTGTHPTPVGAPSRVKPSWERIGTEYKIGSGVGVKLGTGVNVGVSEGVSNVNVWEGVTLGVVVMGGSVGKRAFCGKLQAVNKK